LCPALRFQRTRNVNVNITSRPVAVNNILPKRGGLRYLSAAKYLFLAQDVLKNKY
jgi:hypothetical protein